MARQKQKKWQVYFDLNAPRKGGPRKQRPGRELPIRLAFSWGGAEWRIPAVYVCAQGLVPGTPLRADQEEAPVNNKAAARLQRPCSFLLVMEGSPAGWCRSKRR